MAKNKHTIELVWEYESGPDSEEQLRKAFKMLFRNLEEGDFTSLREPKPGEQQRLF